MTFEHDLAMEYKMLENVTNTGEQFVLILQLPYWRQLGTENATFPKTKHVDFVRS
jgi:hypothetical protein